MEDEIIIQGNSKILKKTLKLWLKILGGLILLFILMLIVINTRQSTIEKEKYRISYQPINIRETDKYDKLLQEDSRLEYNKFYTCLAMAISSGILLYILFIYFLVSTTEITITNNRVYGITAFNKRVDLPFDLISSVGTSLFNGIIVGTSSGKIKFIGISNNKEIHDIISKLLNERQNNKREQKHGGSISQADELKKYKDLLDTGVITQDEFDQKKKQLLNL